MSKTFTVFGATGKQGGSIIRAVQANPSLRSTYSLRAVTRDPASRSARALADSGVALVQADLNDPSSVQKAVAGSALVFGVTNAWDPATGGSEAAQGKAIADAAAAAGAELFIWSSLPGKQQIDRTSESSDITPVGHFDAKAEVERYVREQLAELPAVFVHPGYFLDNYSSPLMQPKPAAGSNSDALTVSFPFDTEKTKLPVYTPADMGTYVAALLLAPRAEVIGKQWFATSEILTPAELARAIAAGTGKKVEPRQITLDQFKTTLPEPAQEELGANMELIASPGYYGSEKAARDGHKAFQDLITKTKAGKLTSAVDFFKKSGL